MSGPIDFAEINRAALAAFPAVLARINCWTGRWADFATGDRGGDPISLVAYLANMSQGEAARLLAGMSGIDTGMVHHG
jgi:hypothetical protein